MKPSRAFALTAALPLALACALALAPVHAASAAKPSTAAARAAFDFGVIAHAFRSGSDNSLLAAALRDTNQARLAFVVATGIKSAAESCSDKLYEQRRALLGESTAPLVLSLAASDWSDCKNSVGRSAAIERLNRLRDLFFPDEQSLGAHPMPLFRLSLTGKFRSYAENAHWESGRVLFATVNWPANNNHYLPEAGRNSEFEDRLVANRAWLKRLFAVAANRKLEGIVLFSDGNVGSEEARTDAKRDGFMETRRQLKTLAAQFHGKVLLIDTQDGGKDGGKSGAERIEWKDNLGHLSVTSGWADIRVGHGEAELFTLKNAPAK